MDALRGTSLDLNEYNIDKLKEIFPEVFCEDKIDFDKLRLLLGDKVEDKEERYEFTWNGKSNAIKIAQTPSTGTLRPDRESSKNWDNTENIYIEGDNLEVLKLLQKSYFGKVKMIYIDPPYNTGKDFVYKDNFRDNIANYKEITNQSTKANPETNGRYHTDWLNMMYPRLKLARNLLREDGLIFISIDDNEVYNLRKICDEVFGEENMISEFAWRRTDNQANIGSIAKVKEYIICYVKDKSTDFKLNKMPLTDKAMKEYSYQDEFGKFRRKNIMDKSRGKKRYIIQTPTGEQLDGPWMIDKDEFEQLDKEGKIYWANGKMPYGKKYLHESDGQIISDWLTKDFGTNQRGSYEIDNLFNKRIFDFTKPTLLIKTFINIATNKNDLILDFFSGSSTTAHAVIDENLNFTQNLKFIMVQLPETTDENSEAYKAGYSNICEIGKERIRRAGDKIVSENKDKEGIENLDIGFKVFKLDSSNLKSWDSSMCNVKDLENQLKKMNTNLKEERTSEDLLYEILLKSGIDLTAKIEEIKVGYNTLYNIGSGALLACLDDKITQDVIDEIPKHKSPFMETKVIFKEAGFMSDDAKINAIQNLKQFKITDVRSV